MMEGTGKKEQLPYGWVVKQSKSYPDRVYYFNINTGASTWEFPDLITPFVTGQLKSPTSPPVLTAPFFPASKATASVYPTGPTTSNEIWPQFSPTFSEDEEYVKDIGRQQASHQFQTRNKIPPTSPAHATTSRTGHMTSPTGHFTSGLTTLPTSHVTKQINDSNVSVKPFSLTGKPVKSSTSSKLIGYKEKKERKIHISPIKFSVESDCKKSSNSVTKKEKSSYGVPGDVSRNLFVSFKDADKSGQRNLSSITPIVENRKDNSQKQVTCQYNKVGFKSKGDSSISERHNIEEPSKKSVKDRLYLASDLRHRIKRKINEAEEVSAKRVKVDNIRPSAAENARTRKSVQEIGRKESPGKAGAGPKRKKSDVYPRKTANDSPFKDKRNIVKSIQKSASEMRNVTMKDAALSNLKLKSTNEAKLPEKDLKVTTSVHVDSEQAQNTEKSLGKTRRLSFGSGSTDNVAEEDKNNNDKVKMFIGDKDKLLSIQSWINNLDKDLGSDSPAREFYAIPIKNKVDSRVVVNDSLDSGYLSSARVTSPQIRTDRGWPGQLKPTSISSREIVEMEVEDCELPEFDVIACQEEEDMDIDVVLSEVREQVKACPYDGIDRLEMNMPESVHQSTMKSEQTVFIVLDTNVLISNLNFLEDLKDYEIRDIGKPILYVPWIVLQELDALKSSGNRHMPNLSLVTQVKARKAVLFLKSLLSIKHPRILGQTPKQSKEAASEFIKTCNDDVILQACMQCQNNHIGCHVVLLTNDNNLINKSLVSRIQAYNSSDVMKGLKNLKSSTGSSLQKSATPAAGNRNTGAGSTLHCVTPAAGNRNTGAGSTLHCVTPAAGNWNRSAGSTKQTTFTSATCTRNIPPSTHCDSSLTTPSPYQSHRTNTSHKSDWVVNETPANPRKGNRARASNISAAFKTSDKVPQDNSVTIANINVNNNGAATAGSSSAVNTSIRDASSGTCLGSSKTGKAKYSPYPAKCPNKEVINIPGSDTRTVISLAKPNQERCMTEGLLQEEKTYTMEALVDDLYCKMKTVLSEALGKVLETEMQLVYDDVWLAIVIKKPPWSFTDILTCWKKHWMAVFGMVFKRHLEHNVDRLIKNLAVTKAFNIDMMLQSSADSLEILHECVQRNLYGTTMIQMRECVRCLYELCDSIVSGHVTIQSISSLDHYLRSKLLPPDKMTFATSCPDVQHQPGTSYNSSHKQSPDCVIVNETVNQSYSQTSVNQSQSVSQLNNNGNTLVSQTSMSKPQEILILSANAQNDQKTGAGVNILQTVQCSDNQTVCSETVSETGSQEALAGEILQHIWQFIYKYCDHICQALTNGVSPEVMKEIEGLLNELVPAAKELRIHYASILELPVSDLIQHEDKFNQLCNHCNSFITRLKENSIQAQVTPTQFLMLFSNTQHRETLNQFLNQMDDMLRHLYQCIHIMYPDD